MKVIKISNHNIINACKNIFNNLLLNKNVNYNYYVDLFIGIRFKQGSYNDGMVIDYDNYMMRSLLDYLNQYEIDIAFIYNMNNDTTISNVAISNFHTIEDWFNEQIKISDNACFQYLSFSPLSKCQYKYLSAIDMKSIYSSITSVRYIEYALLKNKTYIRLDDEHIQNSANIIHYIYMDLDNSIIYSDFNELIDTGNNKWKYNEDKCQYVLDYISDFLYENGYTEINMREDNNVNN